MHPLRLSRTMSKPTLVMRSYLDSRAPGQRACLRPGAVLLQGWIRGDAILGIVGAMPRILRRLLFEDPNCGRAAGIEIKNLGAVGDHSKCGHVDGVGFCSRAVRVNRYGGGERRVES